MRHVRMLLALVTMTTAACSGAEPDAEQNAGAITPEEETAKFRKKELLLRNWATGSESAKALGVTAWTVYKVTGGRENEETSHIIAYATDRGGDIRYALSVAERDGSVAIVRFEKSGGKEVEPISSKSYGDLVENFEEVSAELQRRATDDKGTAAERCGQSIAAGAMLVVAGSSLLGAAALRARALALTTATAALSFVVGVPLVSGGGAMAVTTIKKAKRAWTDALSVCAAATRAR